MTAASPARIAGFLEDLATIGRDAAGGFSRLAFSAEERQAHDLFRRSLEEFGVSTSTDAVGNSFGELEGSEELRALVTGSHLDTVYSGGNYDGAVGVAAAVEAARILSESGSRNPVRFVAFAAEEGARFGVPCIGSRLITGAFGVDELGEFVDRDGVTAANAARAVGLKPEHALSAQWDFSALESFVEVHIEQGRVLEERKRPLGIVHSIGGSTRVELTFEGRSDHSGATPMWLRRDALAGASEFVLATERRAGTHATTVATVGRLDVAPNSITTVPGQVLLQLDVRDIDSERQRDLAEALLDDAVRIAAGRGLAVSARRLSDQSPVVLHGAVHDHLGSAAAATETPFISLPSGASHDAAHLAKHLPTGMIFVPCRGGISHSKEEYADPQRIAEAVDVLVEAFHAMGRQATRGSRPSE